jgi:hypothetical protein
VGKLVFSVGELGLKRDFLAWAFLLGAKLGPGWNWFSSIEREPGNKLEVTFLNKYHSLC